MKEHQKTSLLYDIHCHAFNLSHPGFLAFINRFFLNSSVSLRDVAKMRFLRILWSILFKNKSLVQIFKKIIIIMFLIALIAIESFLFTTLLQSLQLGVDTLQGVGILLFYATLFFLFLIFNLMGYYFWKRYCGKLRFKVKNIFNLLSLVDSNIGRQFMYMELDLINMVGESAQSHIHQKLWRDIKKNANNKFELMKIRRDVNSWTPDDKKLKIGNATYDKFIITPLMMDFYYDYYKDLKNRIHYDIPPRKPILDQLDDLNRGIEHYNKNNFLGWLDIRPFMGLNPAQVDLGSSLKDVWTGNIPDKFKDKLVALPPNELSVLKKLSSQEIDDLCSAVSDQAQAEKLRTGLASLISREFNDSEFPVNNTLPKMLDKYFVSKKKMEGSSASHLPALDFCGIKVYPPLGFDPWPHEEKATLALEKVKYLYKFCLEHRIPITTHCSDGGFVAVDRKKALEFCDPEKWEDVLGQFKGLKVNFAHFGSRRKGRKSKVWFQKILKFIIEQENVYADVSYSGVNPSYYSDLSRNLYRFIDEYLAANKNSKFTKDQIKEKISKRILFGTDFLINLVELESYEDYLEKFFSADGANGFLDKMKLITSNPHTFLFG